MNLNIVYKSTVIIILSFNLGCTTIIKALFPPKYEKKAITSSEDDISDKYALMVFRMTTDPKYSASGKVIKKDNKKANSKVKIYFSRDPMILERENETYWSKDFYINKRIKFDKFYVVKVKAGEPFFWLGYNAEINKSGIPFLRRPTVTGATVLKKWIYGNKNKLKGGRAYYLGTVTMHLDDRSYKQKSYQKYDKTRIHTPVPFEVDMDQGNFAEVNSWFQQKFPNVKTSLKKLHINVAEEPRARDKFKIYEIR